MKSTWNWEEFNNGWIKRFTLTGTRIELSVSGNSPLLKIQFLEWDTQLRISSWGLWWNNTSKMDDFTFSNVRTREKIISLSLGAGKYFSTIFIVHSLIRFSYLTYQTSHTFNQDLFVWLCAPFFLYPWEMFSIQHSMVDSFYGQILIPTGIERKKERRKKIISNRRTSHAGKSTSIICICLVLPKTYKSHQ